MTNLRSTHAQLPLATGASSDIAVGRERRPLPSRGAALSESLGGCGLLDLAVIGAAVHVVLAARCCVALAGASAAAAALGLGSAEEGFCVIA
jgi:hypothetical protein